MLTRNLVLRDDERGLRHPKQNDWAVNSSIDVATLHKDAFAMLTNTLGRLSSLTVHTATKACDSRVEPEFPIADTTI